jgi:hypothetical protein
MEIAFNPIEEGRTKKARRRSNNYKGAEGKNFRTQRRGTEEILD